MVSFITIPAVTLHGITAFSCLVYAVKGGLCPAAFSASSTFIILFEVAGNHKDGVPPAYLGHAIRAAGGSGGASVGGVGHRLSFLFSSILRRSIFACALAFLKFSPIMQTGQHISVSRS